MSHAGCSSSPQGTEVPVQSENVVDIEPLPPIACIGQPFTGRFRTPCYVDLATGEEVMSATRSPTPSVLPVEPSLFLTIMFMQLQRLIWTRSRHAEISQNGQDGSEQSRLMGVLPSRAQECETDSSYLGRMQKAASDGPSSILDKVPHAPMAFSRAFPSVTLSASCSAHGHAM